MAANEFYKKFNIKNLLPKNTTVLTTKKGVYPPYSSNQCNPFVGVLLKTTSNIEPFKSLSKTLDVQMAFYHDDEMTLLNYPEIGLTSFKYSDCETCKPQIVADLIDNSTHKPTEAYSLVVLFHSKIKMPFEELDMRCH